MDKADQILESWWMGHALWASVCTATSRLTGVNGKSLRSRVSGRTRPSKRLHAARALALQTVVLMVGEAPAKLWASLYLNYKEDAVRKLLTKPLDPDEIEAVACAVKPLLRYSGPANAMVFITRP